MVLRHWKPNKSNTYIPIHSLTFYCTCMLLYTDHHTWYVCWGGSSFFALLSWSEEFHPLAFICRKVADKSPLLFPLYWAEISMSSLVARGDNVRKHSLSRTLWYKLKKDPEVRRPLFRWRFWFLVVIRWTLGVCDYPTGSWGFQVRNPFFYRLNWWVNRCFVLSNNLSNLTLRDTPIFR